MKLKPIINTELSEYTIKILAKQRINTVAHFIRTPIEKLMKILNLNEDKVFKIITSIEKLYGGHKQNLQQQEQEWKKCGTVYKTGIIPLDNILGCESLKGGVIWEFCGLPGIGKTQLAFSVLINFIISANCQGLYIDTKMDFSPTRIQQMLKEKGFECMEQCFNIMERIKVERCLSLAELVQVLNNLEAALERHHPSVSKIKLIIIDSIPAIWYQLKNTATTKLNSSIKKRCLLQFDRFLHKLAQKYNVIIIIINISLNFRTISRFEPGNTRAANMMQRKNIRCQRPSLGIYWKLMPRLRLSLEYPQRGTHNDASLRIIKLIRGFYIDNTVKSCKVHLTEQGVI